MTLPQIPGSSLYRTLAMSYHWVRFYYWCDRYVNDADHRAARLAKYGPETLRQYLVNTGFSTEFIEDVLYPVVASICTCSYPEADQYPASVILEFFGLGLFFEGGSVVTKGVREVCTTLSSRLTHVHLKASVEAVYNDGDGVVVKCAGHAPVAFDYVIFASQANQALRMLRDPSAKEVRARNLTAAHRRAHAHASTETAVHAAWGRRPPSPQPHARHACVARQHDCLSRYHYVKTKVVVHTDSRFLPGASHLPPPPRVDSRTCERWMGPGRVARGSCGRPVRTRCQTHYQTTQATGAPSTT